MRASLLAAVTGAAVILAGCSSSVAPAKSSGVSVPSAPQTEISTPITTATVATETLPPPPDPDVEAAKAWINTAPHRLDVELMAATAAKVRRELGGDPSAACMDLVSAAFALDDEFPALNDPGRHDVMIDQLVEAATQYTFAGNSCGIGLHSGVKSNLDKGDADVRRAEARAKALHTTI